MCNVDKFGSLDFCVEVDARILRIKVYQELCHGVLSLISKDFLDDMPRTMITMKTRFYQMANLLNTWVRHMDEADRREALLGTRIEVTVLDIEKIKDARGLCCRLDLLRIEGLERHLQGLFIVRSIEIGDVLINLHAQLQRLLQYLNQSNTAIPTLCVQTALTRARQALGWSGKNMDKHLQVLRQWMRDEGRREAMRANGNYTYDGCEEDGPDMRANITDFLANAHWYHAPRDKPDSEKLMLRRVTNGGQWGRAGVYLTRVQVARIFVG
jgi:hypothetical protein